MQSDDPDYLANRSPAKMFVLIALLIVIGLLLLTVDFAGLFPRGAVSGRGAKLVGLLPWMGWFAIVAGALFIPLALKRGVEIEISRDGILYPPALKEMLPWDRVERVAIRKMSVYRVLAVWIRDADDFPIKPMARKVGQMNKMSGDLGDINLDTGRSDGNFDDLLEAVSKHVRVEPLR